VFYKPAVH